jgi:glutamate racemase
MASPTIPSPDTPTSSAPTPPPTPPPNPRRQPKKTSRNGERNLTSHTQTTIGVFDSGFGGLTVLRALLPLIPEARYIYLGDTARLPYGSKSRETIARYAVSSAKFLHEQGAELLVIACNTATALALEDIQQALPIPVIGVVEPGAKAAVAASNSQPNQVLVLATAATVQSHAYARALNVLGLEATEKACPLLVPLVEEGWINHPVTEEVLKIYLTEALAAAPSTKTLLLGCTHYPLLEPAIHRTLQSINHSLTVIDSAEATARAVATHLGLHPQSSKLPTQNSECIFYATDSIEKFQHLGSNFLGQPVAKVNLIDLGG